MEPRPNDSYFVPQNTSWTYYLLCIIDGPDPPKKRETFPRGGVLDLENFRLTDLRAAVTY